MENRVYWYSNPDALIVGAVQALEAKTAIARHLGRGWDEVDAELSSVLLDLLRRMPEAQHLRRREDRTMLRCVVRLIDEMSDDDPRKVQVERRLQEKMR